MHRLMLSTALTALFAVCAAHSQPAPSSSNSDSNDFHPTVMLGMAFDFGRQSHRDNFGLTAKLLSTNEVDQFVLGGGITYFPWADDKLGLDVGVGYNFNDVAAVISYDFVRKMPQISGGWVPTEDDDNNNNSPLPPSDSRLKHDVRLVAILDDGMKIYSFKYKWSNAAHVGVMAQDLLKNPAWRDAVVMGANGFYRVNYRKLGLRMVTLDAWIQNGLAGIVHRERRAKAVDLLAA